MKPHITVISLGPGDPSLLTLQAAEALRSAKNLVLRTARHPVAEWLRGQGIFFSDLDAFYTEYEDFDRGYYNKDDYVLSADNYTYFYSNNDKIGTATLTVQGKGEYTGTLTAKFNISRGIIELTQKENSDLSVTITSPKIKKASDIKKVEVWTDNYNMVKGQDYTVAADGAVTILPKFLKGETGYKPGDLKPEFRITTDNYLGYIKIKMRNISKVYYTSNSPLDYTGKNRSVKLYLNGAKQGVDYKIVYSKSKRKQIGKYTYTVKGINGTVGSFKGSFIIRPKTTSKVTASRTKKSAKIKWKKVSNCSGYQIQLIRPSEEESDMISYDIYKKATVKGKNNVSKTFKSVSSSKYTRVRVRSFKTVNGKKYYSKWKYKSF